MRIWYSASAMQPFPISASRFAWSYHRQPHLRQAVKMGYWQKWASMAVWRGLCGSPVVCTLRH